MDRAERWIALSDGGSGLEDWLRTNFGRVEAVILDFYHATEYLGDLGRALHPERRGRACGLAGRLVPPAQTRGGYGGAGRPSRPGGPWRRGARGVDGRRAYFENQSHRMDYPDYVAKGWAIGSGPVESACKTVIGQRMKGAGMRVGRGRRRQRRPSSGVVQERRPAVGRLLASGTELRWATYKSDAYPPPMRSNRGSKGPSNLQSQSSRIIVLPVPHGIRRGLPVGYSGRSKSFEAIIHAGVPSSYSG